MFLSEVNAIIFARLLLLPILLRFSFACMLLMPVAYVETFDRVALMKEEGRVCNCFLSILLAAMASLDLFVGRETKEI